MLGLQLSETLPGLCTSHRRAGVPATAIRLAFARAARCESKLVWLQSAPSAALRGGGDRHRLSTQAPGRRPCRRGCMNRVSTFISQHVCHSRRSCHRAPQVPNGTRPPKGGRMCSGALRQEWRKVADMSATRKRACALLLFAQGALGLCRPDGDRPQVKGVPDRREHALVVGVGVGNELVVIELDDEGDLVRVLARDRPQDPSVLAQALQPPVVETAILPGAFRPPCPPAPGGA